MATSCSYYAFPPMISCTAESRPPRFGLPRPSTSSSSAAYKSNFGPVEEIGKAVRATAVHGSIPHDFPEGVHESSSWSTKIGGSIFGKSNNIWVEGEGMLHALYFNKDHSSDGSSWTTFYNNKYVTTDTLELEKQRKKPVFLPATEGDPPAVLSAFLLNLFGVPNKNMSNTNVFEHAGKLYAVSENDVAPYEIDIHTLETLGTWDHGIAQSWNRPSTSHPKRAPYTDELVTIGTDARKPYLVVGVISVTALFEESQDLLPATSHLSQISAYDTRNTL
ncbi:UNVERIFIED_CONTAM: hypothetical protein Scaly_0964400 [Sesamum calycinum]|uniref:Uncharacterized protein n=1 Tax=Sesamum calycinum TaxID=2727403 RepID=A0AAW2QYV1_9LAMI